MSKCALCGKELRLFNLKFGNNIFSNEYYCFDCWKNKKRYGIDPEGGDVKQQLLTDLKKKHLERELELKISNKKKTKEDRRREEKIKRLEEEIKTKKENFKISTSEKVVRGGLLGGIALSMVGVGMMIIGAILTFTIIGAIIGIPLLIIGFIILLGSGLVAGGGVLGGLIIKIKELFKKKK